MGSMRALGRRALSLLVSAALSGAAVAQVPTAPTTPPVGTAPTTPPVGAAPLTPPAVPAAKPEVRPTGTAAKVNDAEIAEVAVWRALRQFPPEDWDTARKEILNHLIENLLIDQYLTALKMTAEPAEVEKLVTELKDELKKAGKDYTKELEAMMLTEDEFRSEVVAQMKWDKFLKQQGTDQALKGMFDAAPSMFDGSMVRARHILLTPGDDKQKQAEAAQKLRGIKAAIDQECAKVLATLPATATELDKSAAKLKKAEEVFALFAKQDSQCPSTKEGGDLNFFPRVGAMVEPFAKAAFDTKVGEMTDVIATEFGYHLVLVTARNPGKQPSFEQAKEAVRAVYAMRLREAVVGQMKPKAKIEITPWTKPATAPVSTTPMIPGQPGR
jgi:peptidyl-prolyl cis-trans isomerase C